MCNYLFHVIVLSITNSNFLKFFFIDWLIENDMPVAFENLDPSELGPLLKKFYGEMISAKGKEYSKSSVLCIRACIQRHLSLPPHEKNLNIMFGPCFKAANAVLTGKLKIMKAKGLDKAQSHAPIDKHDIDLLYSSGALSDSNPTSLQHKVYFEISMHFARRGREGLRELNKDDILIKTTPSGGEYATLDFNPLEKNHPVYAQKYAEHDQRMYATKTKTCPVASLRLYLSKLNPKCRAFFQRPKISDYENNPIWYINRPVGVHTIGQFMKTISDNAGCQQQYTNHCTRATAITTLRDAGIGVEDIMAVTGHRCPQSINSYSKTSDKKREGMSNIISHQIGIETLPNMDNDTKLPIDTVVKVNVTPKKITAVVTVTPTKNKPQASPQKKFPQKIGIPKIEEQAPQQRPLATISPIKLSPKPKKSPLKNHSSDTMDFFPENFLEDFLEPDIFDSPNKIPPSQPPSQKMLDIAQGKGSEKGSDQGSDSEGEDILHDNVLKAARALFQHTNIKGCTFNLTFNYK